MTAAQKNDRTWQAIRFVPVPMIVSQEHTIVQLAAGAEHSLLVTAAGAVLSCGVGARGRLGHGDESSCKEPKAIVALKGQRMVQAAAGGAHSLMLTAGGAVWSCGDCSDGRLGHGHNHLLVPTLLASLKRQRRRVVQIAAGGRHSLMRTASGDVLACGHLDGPRHGRLSGSRTHRVPKTIVRGKRR